MSKRARQDIDEAHAAAAAAPLQQQQQHPGKYTHLDDDAAATSDTNNNATTTIHCTLSPHQPLSFPTYQAYEVHYQQSHINRCTSCHANLPTPHLLNLHISENHDPIIATRRDDRGEKTYACFVQECDKVCSTWRKRRMHLIAKHGFHKDYDVLFINDGIDHRTSMLRSDEKANLQSQTLKPASAEASIQNRRGAAVEDDESAMNDISNSMAALKFVPKSVTFGRKQGGGLAKS